MYAIVIHIVCSVTNAVIDTRLQHTIIINNNKQQFKTFQWLTHAHKRRIQSQISLSLVRTIKRKIE